MQTLLSVLEMKNILPLETMSSHPRTVPVRQRKSTVLPFLGIPIYQWFLNISLVFVAYLAYVSVLVVFEMSDDSCFGRLNCLAHVLFLVHF